MRLAQHIFILCLLASGGWAQDYISDLIADGNVPSCVIAPIVEPLYFASPTGSPTAAGTQADPYDLRSALDGTQSIPDGETLYLLPGVYDDVQVGPNGGPDRHYDVAESNLTIQPFAGRYTAEVRGGFTVLAGTTNNCIQDILFVNPDTPPGGEPTQDGTWPGFPGPYDPPEFEDWGSVGVNLSGSDHKVANNVAYGGSIPYVSFQAVNSTFSGNIAYDFGWDAPIRSHGHGAYLQNPTDINPASVMTVENNMFSSSATTRNKKGSLAAQFFETNDVVEQFSVVSNAFKGGTVFRSESVTMGSSAFLSNVVEEIFIPTSPGAGGNESSFGKPGANDGSFSHTDNTYVNSMLSLANNDFPAGLITTNTRVFKTDASLHWSAMRGPPASAVLEEGTFSDVSGGGGVDESRVWVSPYDANRANMVLLDLDLDNTVAADPTNLLTVGDTYNVYHYQDVVTSVQTGTYAGGNINIPLIEAVDSTDYFILTKS